MCRYLSELCLAHLFWLLKQTQGLDGWQRSKVSRQFCDKESIIVQMSYENSSLQVAVTKTLLLLSNKMFHKEVHLLSDIKTLSDWIFQI